MSDDADRVIRLRFHRNDPALVLRSVSAVVDAVLTDAGATIDELDHVRHGLVEIVDAMVVGGGATCVESRIRSSGISLRLDSAADRLHIDEPARQIVEAVFTSVEVNGGSVLVGMERTGRMADG